MKQISQAQLIERLRAENPWWDNAHISEDVDRYEPRAYFDLFFPLVRSLRIRRAVVLMGPRRVGKTVMIHHTIRELIRRGVHPQNIGYFSIDHPLYSGQGLHSLVDLFQQAVELRGDSPRFVFFDEVQYLKNWEVHLKTLVDDRQDIKFVVSGSAAAALSFKSHESGAGRFTDFSLPPLTFYEYMGLLAHDDLMEEHTVSGHSLFLASDLEEVNQHFVDYLNFGGYPEVVFSEEIRRDPARFIKSDIIDKVLLRDLPGIYGISDVQELNRLFTTLAFNTSQELSLQGLSQYSGVAKNTIKRYLEYLEATFLIKIVNRVDETARRFSRQRNFKVYLTNPSMRSALFAPVAKDAEEMGGLAETAVFSQYFHDDSADLFYSRWKKGEVDMIRLDSALKPEWALEIKWSDRYFYNPSELHSLITFCKQNQLSSGRVSTRTIRDEKSIEGVNLVFIPISELCYTVGYNNIHSEKGIL